MTNRRPVAIGCRILIVFIVLTQFGSISSQDEVSCGPQNPLFLFEPWTAGRWCVERVLEDAEVGGVGYTHLTTDADGGLYATLPMQGRVVKIVDTNADGVPDTPQTLAEGLTRPVGIDYHDGALYIAGNGNLYRHTLATSMLTVVASDIPWGWTGYPTAGLTVHNERVYITSGGDEACTPERGAIYSYALNGEDRQRFASGLVAPSDVVFHAGQLWAADAAQDMVLQVSQGEDYGACDGERSLSGPHHNFLGGSAPFALESYTDDLHEMLTGSLLVSLRGVSGEVVVKGYAVEALPFTEGRLVDASIEVAPVLPPERGISRQRMHIQGSGFYPDHVYGITTDPNGWIYISYAAGGIVLLRSI